MASKDNVHVTLLGDSIFDNKSYVRGHERSVTGVLERRLSSINKDWKVTNCSVDGAVAASVARQISTVPSTTTHIFVSVIGNDCLRVLWTLRLEGWEKVAADPTPTNPVLADILNGLAKEYTDALVEVKKLGLPFTVANLYAPRFEEDQAVHTFCHFAVQLVNARLKAIANAHGAQVIDLFSLFTHADDYANSIEPGVQGSEKIAKAIEDVLLSQLQK